MSRECGDCIVCCVYPRIADPELTKAGMVHCPNLTLPGSEQKDVVYYTGASCTNCHIYDHRPRMCADYKCAWRHGYGGDDDRPDKVLMLFDNAHQIENALEAKPLKDGQEKTSEAQAVIGRMSRSIHRPVIVLNFYERCIQKLVGRGV